MLPPNFQYHAGSHEGLVRTNNEDRYGDTATPYGQVFVVCDGMGGHAAGEKAAEIATDAILHHLKNADNDNHREQIEQAIQNANKTILEAAAQEPAYKGMGTTCVVLYLTHDKKYITAHVGDSRIYLFRNRQIKRITRDHSYVQFLVDIGDVSPEEAENHPDKNRIMRALGIGEELKADVSEMTETEANSMFLLCSDGLSDMVNDKHIEKVLSSYQAFEQDMVTHLITDALNAGGKDNVTVSLIHLLPEPEHTLRIVGGKKSNKWIWILCMALILLLATMLLGKKYYPTIFNKQEKKPIEQKEAIEEPIKTPADSL